MKKSQIYKQLIAEYDRKRMSSQLELEARRKDIYEKIPEVKQIDNEIAALGFKMSYSALNSPESAQQYALQFEKSCIDLIGRKNEILEQNHIPKKYLEPRYSCENCKDTGFIGGTECKCFKAKKIQIAFNRYSIKEKLEAENFDTFDFRLFSDEPYKEYAKSPKANIEIIYKYCVKFTSNFEQTYANIMFYGNPGLGKTFLCNCISKELLQKGFGVLYFTAFQLFRLIDDIQFDRIEDSQNVLDDILNADLLVIDDLGTEFTTAVSSAGLFNIINSRANARKPLIISTNLYPSEIKDTYTERITSRIFSNFTAFELYGENVGSKKKYRKLTR